MLKFLYIFLIIAFPLKVIAQCNDQETYDSEATVTIPKPSNLFGSPKLTPEIIEEAKTLAKQKVLQSFISQCIKERKKLDQYLKVKDKVNSQVSSIVNILDTEEKQKESKFNIKIIASVNSGFFESLLYGQGSDKKRKGMVSFFIARKAESTDTKVYEKKISKIQKNEKGKAAEESATTDGTTTLVNKQDSSFTKKTTGGSSELKQRSSKRQWIIMPSSDLNSKITETLSNNGFNGVKYSTFAGRCGAPPSDLIEEEFSSLDKLTDDTENAIYDAIDGDKRCSKRFGFVTMGTINVGTASIDNTSGLFSVLASIRVDISQIVDGFPEVVASIGPIQIRSLGQEDMEAEKNALIIAGEKAAQEIVNTMNAKGL